MATCGACGGPLMSIDAWCPACIQDAPGQPDPRWEDHCREQDRARELDMWSDRALAAEAEVARLRRAVGAALSAQVQGFGSASGAVVKDVLRKSLTPDDIAAIEGRG